jgi:adhesin transport system outer membrane protein
MNKFLRSTMLSLLVVPVAQAEVLGLDAAVNRALSTNPELVVVERDRTGIHYQAEEAKGGKRPQVDFEAVTGWEHSNNSTTRGRGYGEAHRDMWRNEARLTVRQNIYNGGETKFNVRQQLARYASVSEKLAEAQDNIALQAVDAYLNVVRSMEQVKLARRNLELHQEYVDQINKRAESGRGNMADVRQAEGRYSLAQANLLASQRDQQDAEAFFLRIVGDYPGALTRMEAPHSAVPNSFEDALRLAMEMNPALISAKHDIESANYAVKAADSMYRPTLDAELTAFRGHDLDGIEGMNSEYSALLRLRHNFYSGGSKTARKMGLKAVRASAEAQLNVERRLVEENLRQSWHALQTARLRLVPLSQHAVSAEETRDAYKAQFDIGQRSLLDLLDAEVELFNARKSLVDEHYTHDVAAYGILANIGTLAERFAEGQEIAAK